MKYQEYLNHRKESLNRVPFFAAFDEKQFTQGMEKVGASSKDELVSLGFGAFMRKADLYLMKEYLDSDNLSELIRDYDFSFDAFLYEMRNCEYIINYQGDYDVISRFAKVSYCDMPTIEEELERYFYDAHFTDETIRAYLDARREYNRLALENNWG